MKRGDIELARGPGLSDPRRQRDSGQPGSEPGAEVHKAGARQRSARAIAKANTFFGEAGSLLEGLRLVLRRRGWTI